MWLSYVFVTELEQLKLEVTATMYAFTATAKVGKTCDLKKNKGKQNLRLAKENVRSKLCTKKSKDLYNRNVCTVRKIVQSNNMYN